MAWPLVCSCAAFGVFSCPPAHAGSDDLARAVAAYDNFEFERASELLTGVISDPSAPSADRARALLYLGLAHYTLGHRKLALHDFDQALQTDRSLKLPPGTSPKIESAFAARRAALPPMAKIKTPPLSEPTTPGQPGPDPNTDTGSALRQTDLLAPMPERRHYWAWTASSVAGVALAFGVTFGVLTIAARKDSHNAHWVNDATRASARARRNSIIANSLFATAGVAAGTGGLAFWWDWP
jgi:hypothetical protein